MASFISKWYVLWRSGFRGRPNPPVELAWGSQSISSDLTSAAAKDAARLMAVVVLPTPPFWLATAITRPMGSFIWKKRRFECSEERRKLQCRKLVHVLRGTGQSVENLLCST